MLEFSVPHCFKIGTEKGYFRYQMCSIAVFFFCHSVACHTQFDRIKCLRFFRSVFVCYACVCSINNEYEAKVMFIKLIEEFHIDNTYHTLKWVKCSGHKIKRKQKTLNERKQREKIHAYTHFMSVMKRWSLSFKYI